MNKTVRSSKMVKVAKVVKIIISRHKIQALGPCSMDNFFIQIVERPDEILTRLLLVFEKVD